MFSTILSIFSYFLETYFYSSQYAIIARMQTLGYHTNNQGVCYGLSMMAAQSLLLGGSDELNALLKQIRRLDLRALTVEKFFDIYGNSLTKDEESKIRTFLQGIADHQNGVASWQLDPVSDSQSEPVIQPDNTQLPTFSGLYDAASLTSYFTCLQESFAESTAPLVLLLRNTGHAITVSFDPKEHSWSFIDANQLNDGTSPVKRIFDTSELAEYVLSAFTASELDELIGGQQTAFATTVLCKQTDYKTMKSYMDTCQKKWRWRNIHTISESIAQSLDVNRGSLLFVATSVNDTDTVKKLLDNGADPNHTCHSMIPLYGLSPLYFAVEEGNLEIVKALLEKGANPNQTYDGVSMLYLAVNAKNPEMVKALLEKGANPNQYYNRAGTTPLFIAAQEGLTEITQSLLKHGADKSLVRKRDGVSPLDIARNQKQNEIVEILSENQDNSDITPSTAEIISAISTHVIVSTLSLLKENISNILFSVACWAGLCQLPSEEKTQPDSTATSIFGFFSCTDFANTHVENKACSSSEKQLNTSLDNS